MELMERLAERYPRLYICPSENVEEAYVAAVTTGGRSANDLSHFIGSSKDWLRTEQPPAGPVEMLFLRNARSKQREIRISGKN